MRPAITTRQQKGKALGEYKRTYKACIPCARRKVKCESEGGKCRRCITKKLDCTYTSKKPWSRDQGDRPSAQVEREYSGPRTLGSTSDGNSRGGPDSSISKDGLSTSVLQRVVSSNSDAMNILFEAALQESAHDTSCPAQVAPELTDADVLRIWNACRFVKMGWFSAYEAMELMDLFFRNMAPLSPVLTDFFASHKNQYYLVTQEPMLCYTILMISSRYHTLPGVGGYSRSFFIHHRLWQHCQHLLLRITLGQEKISKAKTRTIGSIEALLLMSEWHPRALQFPPETDGWDSDFIMTSPDIRDPPSTEDIPVSSRWREDVVEPTKRFERMSWMVLNSALALAHELGVFSCSARLARQDDLVGLDAERYLEYLEVRRRRLPSLLFTSINSLSSRLGCTSPMPSEVGISMPETRTSLLSIDRDWLLFMSAWTELMKLTSSVTDTLFPLMNVSNDGTSDTFIPVLDRKQVLLANWKHRYLAISDSGLPYTSTLFIEYQHLRILINSIGMQRIVQRVLQNNTQHQNGSTIDSSFIERARQLDMTTREYSFIEEVIDGCCQTLERVTTLGESLHFSPMRTLFRTISSSIFLMKALALGVRNSKLQEALQILDRAIAALLDTDQDDVHLKSRYAALLQTQVSRLRESLVSSYSISHEPDAFDVSMDMDLSDVSFNGWLSLPFDSSMAPFGSTGDFDRLDGVDLDLDFLWQLPP
ncbi:uncharacterized protein N7506_002076 [Penicillium brevicompactum]|uniref:uncharacterized protein n=1 Tax=Penicillium brevicompactum TaxID=5074 RepID=UPI00254265F3|nr:uncharacterized protein N7506_002076 [Penicillium brevicompactum]KAJ5348823.1 hypothetical protein N7506_002076 [Penicillium brevicompactum]